MQWVPVNPVTIAAPQSGHINEVAVLMTLFYLKELTITAESFSNVFPLFNCLSKKDMV